MVYKMQRIVNAFLNSILFPVIRVIGGVIATPFALAISAVILPVLYYQRSTINGDLRCLTTKIAELHGNTPRFGRVEGQDYKAQAPKRVVDKGCKTVYKGKFTFDKVEDLSWLWHEHHRLTMENLIREKDRKISAYWTLAIPVAGIYCYTSGQNSIRDRIADDPEDVKEHFEALRWKLLNDRMINIAQYNLAKLNTFVWSKDHEI